MSKNNFTNENEFDFKFDFSGVMPELEKPYPDRKWWENIFNNF